MNQELIDGLQQLIAFIQANEDFDFTAANPDVVLNYRTWYLSGADDDAKKEKIDPRSYFSHGFGAKDIFR